MAQIAVANRMLEAAVCSICPGGFKIWPASALDAHVKQHAEKNNNGYFECRKCHKVFHHAFNEGRERPSVSCCGLCRMEGAKIDTGKKRNVSSGSGVSKYENINIKGGAR